MWHPNRFSNHLFNFTTKNEFLIQIALFGQPELRKRIQRFKSLESRMYMAKLQPFNLRQTHEMMQFRWTVAGGKKLPFDDETIEEIFRLTGGTPEISANLPTKHFYAP